MVDVFEEVEEQLRSDRYQSLARRGLPWVLGLLALCLLVALGVWGYTQYRDQGAQKASTAYAAGLDSLGKGDTGSAFAHFGEAARGGSKVYHTLALMQQGGIRLNTGDTAQAVTLFDQAAKDAPNPVLGDAARLKAAFALFDTASYADISARLTPLADAKQPYRSLAREALAMAKLKAGKIAEARADFQVLTTVLDAPDDLRQRAGAAITLIDGGTATAIPASVKAALTLPNNISFAPPPQGPAPAQQSPEAGAAQ